MKAPYRQGVEPTWYPPAPPPDVRALDCPRCCSATTHCREHCRFHWPGAWGCPGATPPPAPRPSRAMQILTPIGLALGLLATGTCLSEISAAIWRGLTAGNVDDVAALTSCAVSAIVGQPVAGQPDAGTLGGDVSASSGGIRWNGSAWEFSHELDVCPSGWDVRCDDWKGTARCPADPSLVLMMTPAACEGTRWQHVGAGGLTDRQLWTRGFLALDGGAP